MDIFGDLAAAMQRTLASKELTRTKRTVFRLLCTLIPLMLLCTAEITLRLCGYGGYDPLIRKVGETPRGTLMITDPAGARGFFFANRERPGRNEEYSFYSPKESNTTRIVLVGGSAIQGFPQSRTFAASAFLKEMLTDCWPERTVEIINLGTTGVASFPAAKFLDQALDYDPDMVVVYSGHNEFYGAYGVASVNRAGRSPRILEMQYRARALALVQAVSERVYDGNRHESKTLMEVMIGQENIGPSDWRRDAAANLLFHHVGAMVKSCRERGVPVIVCTLPSNERDLAPIGIDPPDADINEAVQNAARSFREDPKRIAEELKSVLQTHPDHARAHFYLGKALFLLEEYPVAREHFLAARDLDLMPWRAPSVSQAAIRKAAIEGGALLCDIEAAFRKQSPGGAIGWEMMDDHVHPSLRGQAEVARAIVQMMTIRSDDLAVSEEVYASLPDWRTYADRLGDNMYDRYGVAHSVRDLFDIPFMRASNPGAYERFDGMASAMEDRMPPEIQAVVTRWQTQRPHAGGKTPLNGMVARGLLRQKRIGDALPLFEVARRSVPAYSSWHLEYVYFWLSCRERLNGELSSDDLELAAEEINRSRFLLQHGYSEPGFTERYVGRLHQMRGEFAEAIPMFETARTKLNGFDRVAADQGLVRSYVETGDLERARAIAEFGMKYSGQYTGIYRQILATIPAAP
jgi:tetratricopeptide (TPR) repeat protein